MLVDLIELQLQGSARIAGTRGDGRAAGANTADVGSGADDGRPDWLLRATQTDRFDLHVSVPAKPGCDHLPGE